VYLEPKCSYLIVGLRHLCVEPLKVINYEDSKDNASLVGPCEYTQVWHGSFCTVGRDEIICDPCPSTMQNWRSNVEAEQLVKLFQIVR
jgi:hypothetical protein